MDKANEEAMTTDQETILILQYIVRMRQMVIILLHHLDHCLFQLKQNEDGIKNDMAFSIQEEVFGGKPSKGTCVLDDKNSAKWCNSSIRLEGPS